jgi:ESS family glutamate:Na+ symporter
VRRGLPLAILLGLTLGFMVVQNVVALIGVSVFVAPRAGVVMFGSASLIGGHGAAIASGPEIAARQGIEGAAEIGIAAATLGLVMASLFGGPIARHLIPRDDLSP